jgi:hypothetical protein
MKIICVTKNKSIQYIANQNNSFIFAARKKSFRVHKNHLQ